MKIFKGPKKSLKKIKFLGYLLFFGLALKLLTAVRNRFCFKDIRRNWREFARCEKKEIKELKSGQEGFGRFCQDSGRLLRDYFIPHEGNGHKPKILRAHSLVAIALILTIVKLSVSGYMFLIYPNSARMSEAIVNDVIALLNQDRLESGLEPLRLDPALSSFAVAKANDMAAGGYFAHESPDGRKPWDWIDRADYPYLYVGENLAMNFSSGQSAHAALMASPSHKKNILNERYRDIGLAVVTGEINGKKTNILVQLFAVKQSFSLALAQETAITAGTTAPAAPPPAKIEAPAPDLAPADPPASPISEPTVAVRPAVEQVSHDPAVASEEIPMPVPIADNEEEEAPARFAGPKLAVIDYPDTALSARLEGEADHPALAANPELVNHDSMLISYHAPAEEGKIGRAARLSAAARYAYLGVIGIITLALIINIFVRLSVQHKPVIVQTLAVIILLSGLLSLRLHFLENVLDRVAVL